ncbi:MAG: hypothetical protein B6I28_00135 [Fusobacteriia bacterium 4572_132]|nr:MAG: hypothetical protein B6I28_00135 [Fusobacteriia bacterium 4572_132]
MKRRLLIIFILLNAILNAGIFKVEKVEGEKPWWAENYVIEGLHSSIGVVEKKSWKKDKTIREEAISSAKAELAGNKETLIKSEINTLKTNTDSKTVVESVQNTNTKLKVEIIDSWENEQEYCVWVVEVTDNWKNDKELIKKMIDENNKKIRERKSKEKKVKNYDEKITEKNWNRVTINIGEKEARKGEVANIYNYSSKKVGKLIVTEVFSNESFGKVNLITSMRVKKGYGVKLTGRYKTQSKKNILLDDSYVIFSENIEQAKIIKNRNYLLKMNRNFDENNNKIDFKYGLFDFFELLGNYDEDNFEGGIKLGIEVKKINIGGIYFGEEKSEILLDYKWMGINSYWNYKNIDSDEKVIFGLAKNTDRVTIYGDVEYDINEKEVKAECAKLTLKIIEDKKIYLDLGIKRNEETKKNSFFMGGMKLGSF